MRSGRREEATGCGLRATDYRLRATGYDLRAERGGSLFGTTRTAAFVLGFASAQTISVSYDDDRQCPDDER